MTKLLISFFFVVIACSEVRKETNRTVLNLEDRIHSFSLIKDEGLYQQNINYSNMGVGFEYQNFPAFVKIDSLDLNLNKGFNISFWFKFTGDDPRKEQMLFSIRDFHYERKCINFWIAGYRLTGKINTNNLWAKDYNYQNGGSREYYDLFQLELGKYYFFSANITSNKLEVYLNSELYAEYVDLRETEININTIYLGILEEDKSFKYQFQGNIRNLVLFERTLNTNEVEKLSIENYNDIHPYNDKYELNKFNLE